LLRVVWRRVTSGAVEPRVSVWGIGIGWIVYKLVLIALFSIDSPISSKW
jgi:hypothetical protein